jgi:hypothetical protein
MDQRFLERFSQAIALDCRQCQVRVLPEDEPHINLAWPYLDGLMRASIDRTVFLLHKRCTHAYEVRNPQPYLGLEDIHRLYDHKLFDARSLLCSPIYEGLQAYFRPKYPSPRFKFGKDVWVFDGGSLVLIEGGQPKKPRGHVTSQEPKFIRAAKPAAPAKPAKPPKAGKPGHVYLIEAIGTPRIKIGHGGSAHQRLKQLSTGTPYPLRLLHTITASDSAALEDALHVRYEVYKRHNEWYELPADVLAALLQEVFA